MLYDGAPIPAPGGSFSSGSSGSSDGEDDCLNLDLSAHSSGNADTSTSDWMSAPTSSGEDEEEDAAMLAVGDPVRLAAKLQANIAHADALLQRAEGLRTLHATSDFVAGGKCTNSGCAVVGLSKYRKRVQCERRNAQRALEMMQTAVPELQEDLCGGHGRPADRNTVSVEDEAAKRAVAQSQRAVDCSSLTHLALLMHCLETEDGVTGVFVPTPEMTAFATLQPHSESVSASTATAPKARLEVDAVTANGLRWVKVRTTGSRTAAATGTGDDNHECELSMEDRDYVEGIAEYVRRAKSVNFAFCQVAEVAVVLCGPIPRALVTELEGVGARVAVVRLPAARRQHGGARGHKGEGLPNPVFPSVGVQPQFICLDTTALLALCSETCFPSELSSTQRQENLEAYKVLREQIRSEERASTVVGGVVEAALQQYTTWNTLEAFEALAQSTLTTSSGIDDARGAGKEWRQSLRPVTLSVPDLAWCTNLSRGSPETEPGLEESLFVKQVDAHRERCSTDALQEPGRAARRPNWIVTDVSYVEFRWMIETIAGRAETIRSLRLLRNVMVVDTAFVRKLPQPGVKLAAQQRLVSPMQQLPVQSKVQVRNRIVFGVADALHAITLTSNKAVVNSAREHGVLLWTRLHPSRSLTELYMHREYRHDGPTRPPPIEELDDGSDGYMI